LGKLQEKILENEDSEDIANIRRRKLGIKEEEKKQ